MITQALKWTLISLSLTALLYFTGGLAAIPFLAPVVVDLGIFSSLVFSPVVGGVLAGLWYGVIKPAFSYYALGKAETPDSPRKLVEGLDVDPGRAEAISPRHAAPYQGRSSLVFPRGVEEEALPKAPGEAFNEATGPAPNC